jgi:phage tail sheath protein FI
MPITPTYPGVYIEEIPSGVRTIVGVATSITAFVGYTARGPINKAVRILNFGDYERIFGGLHRDSEIGYAVQQFFLNGGAEAWIVRVAAGAVKASITLENKTGGGATKTLVVTAKSEGVWGNYLRLDVDYNTTNPDSSFNLTITELIPRGTELMTGRVETHRNLSMDQNSSQYAVNVINAASQLVQISRHTDVNTLLASLPAGWSLSGDLSSLTLPGDLNDTKRFISITVDGDGPYEIPIFPAGSPPTNLGDLSTAIQNSVRAINPGLSRFSGFTAQQADALGTPDGTGNFILLTSGTPAAAEREHSSVRIANASNNSASQTLKLGLSNGGREQEAAADLRPSQTGTVSGDLANLTPAAISALDPTHQVTITIADGATTIGTGTFTLGSAVTSLLALASKLQEKIRAVDLSKPVFSRATVQFIDTRLRILSGTDATNATVTLANSGGGTLATDIKLDAAEINVQRYAIGSGVDRGAQIEGVAGNDGTPPNATLLRGSRVNKTGIYALEDVDIFNLLCIPRTAEMDDTSALSVLSEAMSYCESKRAFLIVDPPKSRNSVESIQEWTTTSLTPHKNAALYFPFIMVQDPLDNFRLRAMPPSGNIAGLYARTDSTRGVWKAPAGTEATLTNVQALAYSLTDNENGVLNPLAINSLRQFPVFGRITWGARTLVGSDQQASEWKYIPVRRLALFIEESLYRGTKWVVFEPNDEPLWAQIRLNVGAFMHDLFSKGAFAGKTPREAYFVKSDKETTTQNDINLGIVNILVGFAPLKPAEFVIIKIQQMAGQIQT